MDYEKRFNQVLARAQEAITYLPDPALKKWLESVFPELKAKIQKEEFDKNQRFILYKKLKDEFGE